MNGIQVAFVLLENKICSQIHENSEISFKA